MELQQRLARLKERLAEVGFTGERRALALLPLCLFGLLYLVTGLNAQPGWGPALIALAAAYFVAFFSLAAGWFWARWYASGLGYSGAMVGIMGIALLGWHPVLGIYTALHGLVTLALLGPKMAEHYDLRPGWRERYGMDEFGVERLGKAVTRGSSALPTLILWALAPREEALSWLGTVIPGHGASGVAGVLALGLLLLALVGFVRRRAYAVLGLAGAAAVAALAVGAGVLATGLALPLAAGLAASPAPMTPGPAPLLAVGLLFFAFAPWARPLARHLLGR